MTDPRSLLTRAMEALAPFAATMSIGPFATVADWVRAATVHRDLTACLAGDGETLEGLAREWAEYLRGCGQSDVTADGRRAWLQRWIDADDSPGCFAWEYTGGLRDRTVAFIRRERAKLAPPPPAPERGESAGGDSCATCGHRERLHSQLGPRPCWVGVKEFSSVPMCECGKFAPHPPPADVDPAPPAPLTACDWCNGTGITNPGVRCQWCKPADVERGEGHHPFCNAAPTKLVAGECDCGVGGLDLAGGEGLSETRLLNALSSADRYRRTRDDDDGDACRFAIETLVAEVRRLRAELHKTEGTVRNVVNANVKLAREHGREEALAPIREARAKHRELSRRAVVAIAKNRDDGPGDDVVDNALTALLSAIDTAIGGAR